MSIMLIIVGILLLALSYYLHKSTSFANKFLPGNIWEGKDGEITVIIDGDVNSKTIKCSSNGKIFSAGALGNREFISADITFHKHIGTKKTHPEYLL